MKVPKDYIAIPVARYDMMMKLISMYDEKTNRLTKLVEKVHKNHIDKNYLDMIECKDLAEIFGINLEDEDE